MLSDQIEKLGLVKLVFPVHVSLSASIDIHLITQFATQTEITADI